MGGIDMIALIIIGYLIGFVTTVKLLKKKSTSNDTIDKMTDIFAGIFFPITLVAVAIFYIGCLLIKLYDWL